MPRLATGTDAASSFEAVGKPALSPMPSSRRSNRSAAKEWTSPTSIVAHAQSASPMASTRCAPKRSATQPIGICRNAYVQKNAENSTPSWLGESRSSS